MRIVTVACNAAPKVAQRKHMHTIKHTVTHRDTSHENVATKTDILLGVHKKLWTAHPTEAVLPEAGGKFKRANSPPNLAATMAMRAAGTFDVND